MAKWCEKNDGGIELHLDAEEREILYDALRHYSAYGERTGAREITIVDRIPRICELMNVLDSPHFRKP